jgi:hypothetical protein
MTAIREQIFAAIEALLQDIDGVGEVERMPSGDPASFPALHLFDDGHRPSDSGPEADAQLQALSVAIDGYVQGGDGAEAHAALNALYAAVIEALFPEPVLGGLAEEIEETGFSVTVAERANKRRLAFALQLTIHYATRRGSPQLV